MIQQVLVDAKAAQQIPNWKEKLYQDLDSITEYSSHLNLSRKTSLASLELICEALSMNVLPFQVIDLTENHLDNQCCSLLSKTLRSYKLEKLMLQRNNITDAGKQALVVLCGQNRQIKSVDIFTSEDDKRIQIYRSVGLCFDLMNRVERIEWIWMIEMECLVDCRMNRKKYNFVLGEISKGSPIHYAFKQNELYDHYLPRVIMQYLDV